VIRILRGLLWLILLPVRGIGKLLGLLLGSVFRPFMVRLDASGGLSVFINRISSSMATQRGLLLMVGTGLLVISLFVHFTVVVLLVSSKSFDRNLYWLCIPFTLLHVGVLTGFTGAMLATPLGQGYKNK
jgi:hypothetical protein